MADGAEDGDENDGIFMHNDKDVESREDNSNTYSYLPQGYTFTLAGDKNGVAGFRDGYGSNAR